VLLTRRTPDGGHQRFTATVPSSAITFDTAGADLALGPHEVRQRDGIYTLTRWQRLAGRAQSTYRQTRAGLLPPVELPEGARSGYVVPALSAAGRIASTAVAA
jgi:hypothetical protein